MNTDNGNDHVRTITLDEALELAARTPPIKTPSSRREGDSWHGDTFENALDKARHGDPKVALRLRQRLGVMGSIQTAPRATQRWGTAGSTVDMGRFMTGEPECMIETHRTRRPSPVVRIGIERAVSAFTGTDTIESTGVSVLAAVEALRTAGIPAAIWVTFTIRGNASYGGSAERLSTQVLIQEAGRPIDIDRLAYWTANPTALRRIAFAIWEQESPDIRRVFNIGGNYGYPTDGFGDYDEIVPATSAAATEWLRDVLARRAGITITD